VCVSVCLQGDISGIIRAIFAKFFVHVAYSCGSVLFWQVDEIARGGGSFGIFFPFGIAFGTHTKTAEQIEMLLGMNCVTWGDNPQRGRGNFGGRTCPTGLALL